MLNTNNIRRIIIVPREKKEKVGRLALAKEIEESLKLIEEKYNLLDACDKDFMEKRYNNKSFVFSTPHPKLFEEEGFNYPFSTFDYLSKPVAEQILREKETAKEIKDKYNKLKAKPRRSPSHLLFTVIFVVMTILMSCLGQYFLTGLFAFLAGITFFSSFKRNGKELTDNYNAVIEWERKMQEYEKNYSKAKEEYNHKIAERDKEAEERMEKAKL